MSFRTASYLTPRRPAFAAFQSHRRSPIRQFHTTLPNMTVHNIANKAEFDEAVKNNPVVLLDAFAVWCGPCKAIAPKLADWSNEDRFKDVFFAKIDVDDLPDLSQELGITAMPTFIAFKDGELAGKFVGARPDKIEELIAAQLPPPVIPAAPEQ
ncbi:putative thioredoxin G6G8.7 [Xylaria arbuscula]|nr:putative thioredoxin G6G8.7 [Xylaria arbuscula]